MNDFQTIAGSDVIKSSRTTINNNFLSIASCFSGSSFPTENLQQGMLCFRTDEQKLYQLVDIVNEKWGSVVTFTTDSTSGEITTIVQEIADAAQTAADAAQTAADAAQTAADAALEKANSALTDFIGAMPTYYKRPSLMTSAHTTITVPANTQVNIGGKGYVNTSDVTLAVSTVGTASELAGKDVYVYACQSTDGSTVPVYVLSLNSTVPTDYTAETSRKIGGFHCLCLATGTISDNAASGYATGDIIPDSIWDLLHRADSENEGMVYDPDACIWVDIYLPSWDGTQMQSAFGGVIIDGYSSFPMHGERFAEYAGKVKKFLLSRDQFQVIAITANQMTNISGSSDPNTTGGHSDTAGRRMVNAHFVEDLCGVLWQWTSDIFGGFNSTGSATTYQYGGIGGGQETSGSNVQTSSQEGNHWLAGYTWQTDGRGTANINIDGTMHLYGDAYGALARALVGGRWGDGSHCGSRCVGLYFLSSARFSFYSARCGSRPRVVNL